MSRARLAEASEILTFSAAEFPRLVLTTSFQSSGLTLLHILKGLGFSPPVLFLNTGYHFSETLEFAARISEEWELDLRELKGEHGSPAAQDETYGPRLFERDPDRCCFINKVRPLQIELEKYDGWISALRRDQSSTRSTTRIFQVQLLPSGKGITKVHPLASWTQEDIQTYMRRHGIPSHPLVEKGYGSIGCRPCTALNGGNDNRGGRWVGFDKDECGIHNGSRLADPRVSTRNVS